MVPNKEEMNIMKVETHGGDVATVYCLHKNPIFFEMNRTLFPTVYSLWKHPECLPTITTWPPVFKNISKGADLMLPGVIVNGEVTPRNLGKLEKGQPVSVKLLGNKAPVAVGVTAMSSGDMYESAMRGKGVVIMHAYEDHLWAHGDKLHPPLIEDTEMLKAVKKREEGEEQSENEEETERLGEANCGGAECQEGEVAGEAGDEPQREIQECAGAMADLSSNIEGVCMDEGADGREEGDAGSHCQESQEGDGDTRTPQERMDELMEFCFKCALKSKVKKNDLPLLTSKFFKTCMQPFCPAGENLDVKKSSDKKLGKFLQRMQKEKYIKVKELSKGVESITEFDRGHIGLRGLDIPEVTEVKAEIESSEHDEFTPPEIVELYTLTAVSLPFFRELGLHKRKGDPITIPELRKYITDYVKEKELQNKNQVTLDPILSDLVLSKNDYTEHMRWEELLSRITAKLSPAYQYTIPGQQPVLKKGRLEPVTLKVQQRAGNKKITMVNNLELFGVSPAQFAHSVQKGMACSASVVPQSGKPNAMEVIVQGNQINFIAGLLVDKYKLPRKYLQGLEQAPKSGKKR